MGAQLGRLPAHPAGAGNGTIGSFPGGGLRRAARASAAQRPGHHDGRRRPKGLLRLSCAGFCCRLRLGAGQPQDAQGLPVPVQHRLPAAGAGQHGIQIHTPLRQRCLHHRDLVAAALRALLRAHHGIQPAPAQQGHQRQNADGHHQLDQGKAALPDRAGPQYRSAPVVMQGRPHEPQTRRTINSHHKRPMMVDSRYSGSAPLCVCASTRRKLGLGVGITVIFTVSSSPA